MPVATVEFLKNVPPGVSTSTPRIDSLTLIDTSRQPSPNIWADCPVLHLLEGSTQGVYIYDRFIDKGNLLATPTITTQADFAPGLKAFGSSGGTIVFATGNEGGGGIVLTETDDDEGASIATIALPFQISRSKGQFWWEVRLKTNTVTDTRHGFFAGLLDQATLSATVPIAAAGTLADENFVGFHRLEGDGDQIDTVYKANGVDQVTVKADAISTTAGVHTAAGALAADTFIKLGMKFTPLDRTLRFYINNVELVDNKVIPSTDGDDFPNDVAMGLVLALLCASNDDAIVTLDWWRAAQVAA